MLHIGDDWETDWLCIAILSKQLQVNRSGRQRHAAWGMTQCSDKCSEQYEFSMFLFLVCFVKSAVIGKLLVERQTGLHPELNLAHTVMCPPHPFSNPGTPKWPL